MASSLFHIIVNVLALHAIVTNAGQVLPRACTRTVNAKSGDSCATLSRAAGITVAQFINYNPSVTSCGGLVPGKAYCVASDGSETSSPPAETSPSLSITKDGQCGKGVTCAGSTYGDCCSEHGWCGDSEDHCGPGCQSAFGNCAWSGPGSSPAPSPTPPSVTTSIATLPPRPTGPGQTTVYETHTSVIVITETSTKTAKFTATTLTTTKTAKVTATTLTTTKTAKVTATTLTTTKTAKVTATTLTKTAKTTVTPSRCIWPIVETETETVTSTSTLLKSAVTTLTSLTIKTSTINEVKTITTAATSVLFQTIRITSIETSTLTLTERACPTWGRPPSNTVVIFPSPTQEGLIRTCKSDSTRDP